MNRLQKRDNGPNFPKFSAKRTAMHLKFEKIWPQSVHPEIVDLGSGQGRSEFETAGVAVLRRGFQMSENIDLGQKMLFLVGH
jgi:tRNA G46 methylase TrmB